MSDKYNTISFCENDYKGYIRYLNSELKVGKDADYDEMFKDIMNFIRIALKNKYQMRIWYDGLAVVIEYNHEDSSLSGVNLEWLDENEYIETYQEDKHT